MFSERVGKNFEQFHWKKEFQRLQDEKDYKISLDYIGLIQSGANTPIKDETVVIESKTNPITYAMLNAEFKSIEELRGKDAPNSERDKMDFLQNFLFYLNQ